MKLKTRHAVILGDTQSYEEQIVKLGGKFDPDQGWWVIPASQVPRARRFAGNLAIVPVIDRDGRPEVELPLRVNKAGAEVFYDAIIESSGFMDLPTGDKARVELLTVEFQKYGASGKLRYTRPYFAVVRTLMVEGKHDSQSAEYYGEDEDKAYDIFEKLRDNVEYKSFLDDE